MFELYRAFSIISISLFVSSIFLSPGENGNATEGITRDKILNQPVLEEGTFLSYASKVCNIFF